MSLEPEEQPAEPWQRADEFGHWHYPGTLKAYFHSHAYPQIRHSHMLRQVCLRPECENFATHDIHPDLGPF